MVPIHAMAVLHFMVIDGFQNIFGNSGKGFLGHDEPNIP
jgi:hypothetical protein